jgi:arsenate reductase
MAEGFLRALAGDRYEVASAGTEQTRVHPLAVKVMGEAGIDISAHTSKTFEVFLQEAWDHVVTVCDVANETCPVFPKAANRWHWGFRDPSAAAGTEEERVAVFREVRDQIQRRIVDWITMEQAKAGQVTR